MAIKHPPPPPPPSPGVVMVKVDVPEVPPTGVVLNTVTAAVPAVAISAVGIAALNCMEETKVVTRSAPFHFTVEVLTKLLPLTVSVNSLPPGAAEEGLKELMAGDGLFTVKFNGGSESPPPGVGLKTVTVTLAPVAISAAVTAAVSCVTETKEVVRSAPFHRTTEVPTKLVPLTVSVNASPPAVAEVGLIEVVVGAGLERLTILTERSAILLKLPPQVMD